MNTALSDSAVLYIDFGMLGLCRNMPEKVSIQNTYWDNLFYE